MWRTITLEVCVCVYTSHLLRCAFFDPPLPLSFGHLSLLLLSEHLHLFFAKLVRTKMQSWALGEVCTCRTLSMNGASKSCALTPLTLFPALPT